MDHDQLQSLLRDTGAAHHQAFIETDGADPEWPLWYAQYLQPRLKPVSETVTQSEIVHHLVELERSHAAAAPKEEWPAFYASGLLDRLAADRH